MPADRLFSLLERSTSRLASLLLIGALPIAAVTFLAYTL